MGKNVAKERQWSFVTYGTSVDTENNGYSGSIAEDNLSVWSLNGKGKLVPRSTDGLAFYYTIIDPKKENFLLSADIQIEQWTFSNGQDGFGLMASDTIGINGDETTLWNNSYMASVTKVGYFYDKETGKPSDVGAKYMMHLGVGSQEKKGITRESLLDGTQTEHIVSTMHTLDTTAGEQGLEDGIYNIVGNFTNDVDMHNLTNVTTFHLSIQRNNTGYIVSYTNSEGRTMSQTYYHEDNEDELTRLDKNKIYLGFYAARNAKVQIRNVELNVVPPQEDEPAKKRPFQYVTPTLLIQSSSVCNKEDYCIALLPNADGVAKVENALGQVLIEEITLTANERSYVDVKVTKGVNEFQVRFTPNADYAPSKYERLISYEEMRKEWKTTYQPNEDKIVYVGPLGTPDGDGSKTNPLDVQSAINGATPGQEILMLGGTYPMEAPLVIERDIDGTEDAYITMMPAEGEEPPIFDFQKKCEGMTIGGDYWHLKGFTVTNSKPGTKGIHLGGSYNILEQVTSCRNGNTGIQVSRYYIEDPREFWPRHNRLLNCTAYLNADPGYTDSDGFAIKLTVGEGNVLEGCISAYNADDGYDMFAKVETGSIGKVVLKNCLAFKNGYIIDEEGKEQHVGIGIGFKLGGSSLPAGHTLIESIAFGNGFQGIASNNCPDCKVLKSISFNNDDSNVGFYTTDAKDTEFYARGVVSFRDKTGSEELLRGEGNQAEEDIYDVTNYYYDGSVSKNTQGNQVQSDWFVCTDMDKAIHGGITRRTDGSIDLNGFLQYTEKAPKEVRFELP